MHEHLSALANPNSLPRRLMHTRDIVVIGASLGGIEALTGLVQQLPADFAASILVVQHTSEHSPAVLAQILTNRGPLQAINAEDGIQPRHGRIYVAPPDRHLLLTEGGIRVVFGPRENRSRPAIDPLFRTAAANYRSRVVGVVLTGLLSDGAAGLGAVERCGGLALVQEPGSAAFPDMPRHALAATKAARQVALPELGQLLAKLVREQAPEPPPVPEAIRIEVQLTERAMKSDNWHEVPSTSTDFTCPECSGAIRKVDDNGVTRFRCRVGHAYTGDDLMAAKNDRVEEALWVALQTLQERAQMLEVMAGDDRGRGWERSAGTLEVRAKEAHGHAEQLREFIARIEA